MSGATPTESVPGPGEVLPRVPLDLVLDASVAIKWYIPEDLAAEARRLMSPRFAMHVPSFFAAECGNTIWKKVAHRREMDREAGREILDLALDVGNAKLAIDDFIYPALAGALDCRLVTADGLFRDVVRATPFAHRILWVTDPL